ncbi:MAG TPA: MFS transporter, partial [Mycobacteriales bacterium]|nr:MFS transporter [Mycobacteriales bacterium]
VGLLLGLYLLSLYVGAIIASGISVPLSQATGGPALALGIWAAPAAAALLVWLPQLRHPRPARPARLGQSARLAGPTGPGPERGRVRVRGRAGVLTPGRVRVHRHALAWQVAAFMGLQSLTYFTTLSWLPLLFRDRGASAARAGFLVSMLGIGGVATALLAPVLAQRLRDQRALITPIVAATAAGIAGSLFAPLGTEVFWMGLLGFGQGAALGVGLYLTIARAATPAVAASLSAMAQGVGYLVAGTGPLLAGVLHTATGGWTVPVLALLAITVVEWVSGMLAARPLTIAEPAAVAVHHAAGPA